MAANTAVANDNAKHLIIKMCRDRTTYNKIQLILQTLLAVKTLAAVKTNEM
jgi:hypothetical protein